MSNSGPNGRGVNNPSQAPQHQWSLARSRPSDSISGLWLMPNPNNSRPSESSEMVAAVIAVESFLFTGRDGVAEALDRAREAVGETPEWMLAQARYRYGVLLFTDDSTRHVEVGSGEAAPGGVLVQQDKWPGWVQSHPDDPAVVDQFAASLYSATEKCIGSAADAAIFRFGELDDFLAVGALAFVTA